MAEPQETFFTLPEINSSFYKKNAQQIAQLAQNFDQFTNNLEQKVDNLLKAQQTEFVRSYQVHMAKLKEQFSKMDKQLKRKNQIIEEYENKGQMAKLLSKIAYLEENQRKNQQTIESQKKRLIQLEINKQISDGEKRKLQEKIKELYKKKASIHNQLESISRGRTNESIPTFTTQLPNDLLSKHLTRDKSYQMKSLNQKSQFSMAEDPTSKLQQQVNKLRKQNRQLTVMSSRYMEQTSEMEQFFIQTVNEIKKNITSRKQFHECTLEDFRKQDKIQLLIRILSHQTVIASLYGIIFGNKKTPSSVEFKGDGTKEKIKLLRSGKLPSITSHRYY